MKPLALVSLVGALLFSGCAVTRDQDGNTRAEVRVTAADIIAVSEYVARQKSTEGYAK